MVLRLVVLVLAFVAASPLPAENVLVAGSGTDADTLQTLLENVGHTVTRSPSDTLPVISIASYDSVWVNTLVALAVADIAKLEAFVEAGGGVYLNGEHPGAPDWGNGEALVNATVSGAGSIVVGAGCTFSGNGIPNPAAVSGITITPYSPAHLAVAAAGCITGLAAANQVVTGSTAVLVGAWRDADMVGGLGRIVIVMDSNWPSQGDSWVDEWVANFQHFLRGTDIFSDGFESEDTTAWSNAVGV